MVICSCSSWSERPNKRRRGSGEVEDEAEEEEEEGERREMPNEGKPVLGFWRGQQRDLDSVTRDWAIPAITVFLLETVCAGSNKVFLDKVY